MRNYFSLLLFIFSTILFAQSFESRTFSDRFKNTNVEYLIISKKGEQDLLKPLFIFCQGSLSRPLQILDGDSEYPLLPFEINGILQKYHLVLISKPGIPLKVDVKDLNRDFSFPKDQLLSKEYILNNNLEYYYQRNNFIVKKLLKEKWVKKNEIIVAGHSEGSYIALEMAFHNKKITHLIYSGGNPLGRMMSIINQDRQDDDEKAEWIPERLEFWKEIVANKDKKELEFENTSFYNYGLSQNFIPKLLSLKIPVLVTYGTKDQNGIFNDYLNVQTIQSGKNNITFKSYFNLDHNFFVKDDTKSEDEKENHWQKVADDWMKWLNEN